MPALRLAHRGDALHATPTVRLGLLHRASSHVALTHHFDEAGGAIITRLQLFFTVLEVLRMLNFLLFPLVKLVRIRCFLKTRQHRQIFILNPHLLQLKLAWQFRRSLA
jgi:hypothetical protein